MRRPLDPSRLISWRYSPPLVSKERHPSIHEDRPPHLFAKSFLEKPGGSHLQSLSLSGSSGGMKRGSRPVLIQVRYRKLNQRGAVFLHPLLQSHKYEDLIRRKPTPNCRPSLLQWRSLNLQFERS